MNKFLIIAGPTGSGKSSLAMRLAKKVAGEIVNCDSVQLFKGFDIGSAKPTTQDRKEIPHHLLDFLSWNEDFDAASYAKAAREAVKDISSRDKVPIIVGGSGLYLRAFLGEKFDFNLPKSKSLREELDAFSNQELFERLQNLNPKRALELHPNDRYRVTRAIEVAVLTKGENHESACNEKIPRENFFFILINPDRQVLRKRIHARTEEMLKQGLVDEVKSLLKNGVSVSCRPMQSIGYKQIADMLQGRGGELQLSNEIAKATSQYAKRQQTWFKKTNPDIVVEDPEVDTVIKSIIAKIDFFLKR